MLAHITINGTRVQYKVSGEGRAVILLHGWGCNIATMASIEAILSPHFKVYTLDFPGFGGSDVPSDVWGVEEYTRMLEGFVCDLHIESPILIGHSFGGRVSILYGSRNDVSKIVLVDAAGAKPRRPLKYYLKVYSYKLYKKLLYMTMGKERAEEKIEARRRTAGSADYNALSGMMRRIFVKVVNEYLEAYMPLIKCPVQLIWGAKDKDTKLREAHVMLKRIPNARLDVIDDAGHYSFLDNPFRFRSYLTAFLKQEIYGK
ncbi:MAG: alpha/beta hydrolase [Bacteroidaceae bacterium]|nr:alpha/beta hydrolase [Bacteroidales bacterium]MBP3670554.1 alpha/beta hydrolase [Bacteroidaceae bacterium]MBQ2978725.1 alpha/beta hydrolase [Bacteroidaceae bacterium]